MDARVMVLALLGTAWITTQPIRAQQTPTAVISDPSVDKQFPPGLSVLTIPSNGSEMDAFLYSAAGPGPHGTVILLHGLPGYEINGDLAQSIRRAGWNNAPRTVGFVPSSEKQSESLDRQHCRGRKSHEQRERLPEAVVEHATSE